MSLSDYIKLPAIGLGALGATAGVEMYGVSEHFSVNNQMAFNFAAGMGSGGLLTLVLYHKNAGEALNTMRRYLSTMGKSKKPLLSIVPIDKHTFMLDGASSQVAPDGTRAISRKS